MSLHPARSIDSRLEGLEARFCLAAGDLDPGFGIHGALTTDFEAVSRSEAQSVIFLPDNKLVAVGQVGDAVDPSRVAVAQFLANGELDPGFGQGGKLTMDLGGKAGATDVVRLPDGRLVIAGTLNGQLLLMRLTAAGKLDTTFGDGGKVVSPGLGGRDLADTFVRVASDGTTTAAAITPNFATLSGQGASNSTPSVHVVHLNTDGSFDRTFGTAGTLDIQYKLFDSLGGIALRPDGRILLAGSYTDDVDPTSGGVLLMQLTAAGKPDVNFGSDGRVSGRLFSRYDSVSGIALDAAGGILLFSHSSAEQVGRFRANGVLDRHFAARGVATIPNATTTFLDPGRIAVQPDGKIVTVQADSYNRVRVSRLTAHGELDTSFGDDGVSVAVQLTTHARVNGFAIQSDGRIVAAAESADDFALVRLNDDGKTDSTFGNDANGIATAEMIGSSNDGANTAILQPDGKVIVAGFSYSDHDEQTQAAMVRYRADGTLDRAFGIDGKVVLNLGQDDSISGLALTANGKIVAVGGTSSSGFVARFNTDGSLDRSFATFGQVLFNEAVTGIHVTSGDKLVLLCSSADYMTDIWRLTAGGLPDSTFGAQGVARLEIQTVQTSNAIALQPDGGVLVVSGVQIDAQTGRREWRVRRLTSTGVLDATFGESGIAHIDLNGKSGDPTSIALQPDGKMVVGGYVAAVGSLMTDFALVRLKVDGSIDMDFADNGLAVTPFPPSVTAFYQAFTDSVQSVVIQPNGQIVAVGVDEFDATSDHSGITRVGIARFNDDGSIDQSFGIDGKQTTQLGLSNTLSAALITPDGKLLAVGTANQLSTAGDFAVAQYQLDSPQPITAKILNGVLKIVGTNASETIRLTRSGQRVLVNNSGEAFSISGFSRIQIDALAGNDTVDASASPVPVILNAGDGNDVLLGGRYADALSGGAGSDTLFGGSGDDTLRGNDGNDYLNGGPGADQLFGDAGNDQLLADLDHVIDRLDGGAGFDRAKGDANDLFLGNEGLLS